MLLQLLTNYVDQRQQAEPWEDSNGASHLEIQKLMYFADYFEPELKLDFTPGRYGITTGLICNSGLRYRER